MIKDLQTLREMEDAILKKQGTPLFSHSIKVYESLWLEGVSLGILPLRDPMEGIEVDIKIARILNSCLKKSLQE